MNQPTMISLPVEEAVVDDFYSTRSSEKLSNTADAAAARHTRKELVSELQTTLANGREFTTPIKTAYVEGEHVVLDGVVRVEVAKAFTSKHKTPLKIKAESLGEMSRKEAFVLAQSMNHTHGVRLTKDQQRHIQLRLHILEGLPSESARVTAKRFDLKSPSSGATYAACIEWMQTHQPELQRIQREQDVKAALEFLSETISRELGICGDALAALGIPSAGVWARAIKEDYCTSQDELNEGADRASADLCRVFHTHAPEDVRKALKTYRKEWGLIIKNTFDEDAYQLKCGEGEF